MKSFVEFINNKDESLETFESALKESYQLSESDETAIQEAVDAFVADYLASGKSIEDLNQELTNEGIIGSILGGLTGFALGKTVGKAVAKALGVEKGVLYDLLTSRLVGAALGASLGGKI